MLGALRIGVAAALGVALIAAAPAGSVTTPRLPPVNAKADYQIGGDYPPPAGVRIVSRDWFAGIARDDTYSICYVNAFQTQADEAGVNRIDERSNWPQELVLTRLGDDPNWGGEYLIDISTKARRARAAAWVQRMVARCAKQGFEAVEFDNLDSWTRFADTPLAGSVPFGRTQAIAYAELLADLAHRYGLAAAQKNTVELPRAVSRRQIGFDFAIAEDCGRRNECRRYREVYGDRVIAIEYSLRAFRATCRQVGSRLSVVLRDVSVSRPGSKTYRYDAC
jgi:hypothetical protein